MDENNGIPSREDKYTTLRVYFEPEERVKFEYFIETHGLLKGVFVKRAIFAHMESHENKMK